MTLTNNRSYKYRIYPNEKQKENIEVIFNNCHFVKKMYQKDCLTRPMPEKAKDVLAEYKNKYPFLKQTDTLALMHVLFKARDKFEVGKFESAQRIKKSYATANYRLADCFKIVDYNHIYLPKVGNVKVIFHRPFPENSNMREVTVTKEADGKYYASIDFEITPKTHTIALDINKSIGLDYSSAHFIVDSEGKEYNMPHFYRDNLEKLTAMRKQQDHCEKGSTNFYKQQKRIIKIHQSIQRSRKDYLHKLSSKMINDYDYICIEDINLSKISQKSTLKNATKDNSYGEFVKMLEYKAKDKGKKIIKVDRWYPSTKTCHVCGTVNQNVALGVKEWICPNCNTLLNRDMNAAINIKTEGLRNCR